MHAHILTKPSRAFLVVSRLELVEPGEATCVLRGTAGSCFKSLERARYTSTSYNISHTVFFFVLGKILPREASANSRPTECALFGPCP